MYNQGDIVVINFPFNDGSKFKKRPVLIISNNEVNKYGDYIVAQITSKDKSDEFSILVLEKDLLDKLPLKSWVRMSKIFTVNKSLILKTIHK
jgi:mRNA interferase MazF